MTVRIINADVMDGLRQLEDESVHCVVTSPPYWGLRDYGVDGQIGLEFDLGGFIAKMVEVFAEVRRVLRKDGTCWLNFGDSYASSINGRSAADVKALGNDDRTFRDKPFSTIGPIFRPGNPTKNGGVSNRNGLTVGAETMIKPKDMCGIPWRVAFALQADGWWLRSDIIWAKPNPMPESVTDRPTKSHEYVFLLTKSERYFYDAEAIREADSGKAQGNKDGFAGYNKDRVANSPMTGGLNYNNWEVGSGRNKRSVWTIATSPFPEAHFATFPPELPEICILAGTSQKGCCAKCGAPWGRETESEFVPQPDVSAEKGIRGHAGQKPMDASRKDVGLPRGSTIRHTLGWKPSCSCNADAIPCTVLDPFSGAGTTALVADRLQRNAIGIELNPTYAAMSERRINGDRGGLLDLMEAAT